MRSCCYREHRMDVLYILRNHAFCNIVSCGERTSAKRGFRGLSFMLFAVCRTLPVQLTFSPTVTVPLPMSSPTVATCSGGDAFNVGTDTTIFFCCCGGGLTSSFGVRGVGEASALSSPCPPET